MPIADRGRARPLRSPKAADRFRRCGSDQSLVVASRGGGRGILGDAAGFGRALVFFFAVSVAIAVAAGAGRFAQSHGNRVSLFAGRAARAPYAERGGSRFRLAGIELRNHLAGQSVHRSGMAEESGIYVEHAIEKIGQHRGIEFGSAKAFSKAAGDSSSWLSR